MIRLRRSPSRSRHHRSVKEFFNVLIVHCAGQSMPLAMSTAELRMVSSPDAPKATLFIFGCERASSTRKERGSAKHTGRTQHQSCRKAATVGDATSGNDRYVFDRIDDGRDRTPGRKRNAIHHRRRLPRQRCSTFASLERWPLKRLLKDANPCADRRLWLLSILMHPQKCI
jgi:hypothetical protein